MTLARRDHDTLRAIVKATLAQAEALELLYDQVSDQPASEVIASAAVEFRIRAMRITDLVFVSENELHKRVGRLPTGEAK